MTMRTIRIPLATAALVFATAACAGEITLFEDEDFRGNSIRLTSEASSLDATGMNDKTRSAIVRDGIAHVRAGAGVVLDSDPMSEARETERKARAVVEAILRAEAAVHA